MMKKLLGIRLLVFHVSTFNPFATDGNCNSCFSILKSSSIELYILKFTLVPIACESVNEKNNYIIGFVFLYDSCIVLID